MQQNLRQSANDPQIQMAEDGITENLPTIDISKSLAPFEIIFDESGNPISSSGILNGAIPTIPSGIFQYVRNFGEDRFTWQPTSSVRISAVVVQTNSGFILAGRSLREIEKRENQALIFSCLAWLFGVSGLFIIEVLALIYFRGV